MRVVYLRKRSPLLHTLLTIALIALVIPLLSGEAKADSIVLDPGPIGPTPVQFAVPLSDLNGTTLSGQTMSLDIIFADSKRVEVQDDRHSVLLRLQTNFSGGFWPFGDTVPGTALLLDSQGNAFTGPMTLFYSSGSNNGGQLFAFLFTGATFGQPNPIEGLFGYYGIHYDFTLPTMSGIEITGASLQFDRSGGISVPEPSSFLLLGCGLAGVFAAKLRRRVTAPVSSPKTSA